MSVVDTVLPIYVRMPIPLQNLVVTAYGWTLHRRRYGAPHRRMLRFLMETHGWSRDRLKEYEFRTLQETLAYASRYVPYYRSLWKGIGLDPRDIKTPDDVRSIPVTEKATVKQDPLAFVSDEFKVARLYRGYTSGTTGKALTTYKDRGCYQRTWAFLERQRRIWGVAPRSPRVSVGVRPIVPMSQDRPPFWRHDLTENNWLFSNFHLSARNLDQCIDKIVEIRPQEINGYPSGVGMLAARIVKRGIADVRPKAVITTAETLYGSQRQVMEEAFGLKVADQYGSAEVVTWVAQCPHGTYHVNHEFGYLESLRGGDPTWDQPGDAVATGFINRAQVLVRYRLGDTIVLSRQAAACPCGWQTDTVAELIGRIDDTLYTPDGRALGRLDIVLKGIEGIAESQLVQDRIDHLVVRMVPERGEVPAGTEPLIRSRLQELFGPSMRIDFATVDRIARTAAGKFRYQVNLVGRGVPGDVGEGAVSAPSSGKLPSGGLRV